MDFTLQPYQPNETIAAIATPPGEGGIAIIRISGEDAIELAGKVFSGPVHRFATHTAHFGRIHDANGKHIDDVLLIVMRGNRSFTGEDSCRNPLSRRKSYYASCAGSSIVCAHVRHFQANFPLEPISMKMIWLKS